MPMPIVNNTNAMPFGSVSVDSIYTPPPFDPNQVDKYEKSLKKACQLLTPFDSLKKGVNAKDWAKDFRSVTARHHLPEVYRRYLFWHRIESTTKSAFNNKMSVEDTHSDDMINWLIHENPVANNAIAAMARIDILSWQAGTNFNTFLASFNAALATWPTCDDATKSKLLFDKLPHTVQEKVMAQYLGASYNDFTAYLVNYIDLIYKHPTAPVNAMNFNYRNRRPVEYRNFNNGPSQRYPRSQYGYK